MIKFFESKNMSEVASGLKKDIKEFVVTNKDRGHQANKENQDKMLQSIRKALKKIDKKQRNNDDVKVDKTPFQNAKLNFSFNKEETEEIMEKLMNRIVAKPNLVADDKLNAKIEKIFNVEAF